MKRLSPIIALPLRYGLIASGLALVFLIGMFYLGRHPLLIAPFLDFRILLFGIFIFFSLKELRDYVQEGILYFWQGIICCFIFVMVATSVAAVGLWIFAEVEGEFISSYVENFTAYLKSFSKEEVEMIGEENFQRNLEKLPSTNGLHLALTYFGQGCAIGLFVSIILSVILRKQSKQ